MATKRHEKHDAGARPRCDRSKRYTVEEAVALVKNAAFAQVRRDRRPRGSPGVNPKHADQMVRGAIVLPHGTGKTRARARVRAGREREAKPRTPAPTSPAATSSCRRCTEGFMDFDRVIATPDMMGAVGKLGRVLGPRGLMPNPKVGTVTFDVEATPCSEAKAGKVEYRVEKAGIVHCRIGEVSFDRASARRERDGADPGARRARSRPTAKGIYLRSITLIEHDGRRACASIRRASCRRPRRRS